MNQPPVVGGGVFDENHLGNAINKKPIPPARRALYGFNRSTRVGSSFSSSFGDLLLQPPTEPRRPPVSVDALRRVLRVPMVQLLMIPPEIIWQVLPGILVNVLQSHELVKRGTYG